MSMSDPISDMITRIRNALMRNKKTVKCLYSRTNVNILNVLKEEGYITSFAVSEVSKNIQEIEVTLKYFEGKPAIESLRRISKPGRRHYTSVVDMPQVRNGLGTLVLSTPQGVIADHKARSLNVGGEILFSVM